MRPAGFRDLFRVGCAGALGCTNPDVQEFALVQSRLWIVGGIGETARPVQVGDDAKLFPQAPQCGILVGFTRTRVATTCVAPKPREMVLSCSPALKKHTVLAVENEDRQRAMESASILMSAQFLERADRRVVFVYENHFFHSA